MLSSFLNTHHALLLEGSHHTMVPYIKDALEHSGVCVENNPDVVFVLHDKFGISESRTLIDMSYVAPVQEKKRHIIVAFDSITTEAQNALLKVFEDPSPHTHFILVTPLSRSLLPTLQSRLLCVEYTPDVTAEDTLPQTFVDSTIKEKTKIIDELLKRYKATESKKEIRDFLRGVYMIAYQTKQLDLVSCVVSALVYLDDKASSPKMLLESVMLLCDGSSRKK